jgi:hypothetical protein
MRSSYSIHNQINFRRPEVHLSVCLCPPNLFSIRSASYQRKVDNYFFPDLLVIRHYMPVF